MRLSIRNFLVSWNLVFEKFGVLKIQKILKLWKVRACYDESFCAFLKEKKNGEWFLWDTNILQLVLTRETKPQSHSLYLNFSRVYDTTIAVERQRETAACWNF